MDSILHILPHRYPTSDLIPNESYYADMEGWSSSLTYSHPATSVKDAYAVQATLPPTYSWEFPGFRGILLRVRMDATNPVQISE